MDYKKLIAAIKLCGSTPKVDECKACAYWAGGDMSKCIPRMTMEAAAAITDLLVYNQSLRNAANGFKDRAEKAINDIYSVRPCSICANYSDRWDDKCWACRGTNEKYHPDFTWLGETEDYDE
jgi:hypothetical protein